VSADSDKTTCEKPAWSPDRVICDDDGSIQEKFKVHNKLPSSFLYSWEGKLSLKSHEVGPVEDAIKNYFKNTHLKMVVDRVNVVGDKCAVSGNPEWLRNYLAGKVKEQSKFDLVSVSNKSVPVVKSSICDADFPPNSTMRILLEGDCRGNRSMTVGIDKDGCTLASATESYKGQGLDEDRVSMEAAASAAVGNIMNQLYGRIKKPRLVGKSRGETKLGLIAPPDEDLDEAMIEEVIVSFDSHPKGASVLLDGSLLCKETPCSKRVPVGIHQVSMEAEDYIKRAEQIEASKGIKVSWVLEPNFGWATVSSEPSELDVKIDGAISGKTPLSKFRLTPKSHDVLISSDCYFEAGERINIERGKERSVNINPVPRQGKVKVVAKDSKGNDVEADVYIDGQKVGSAPGTFKVNVCAREIEVKGGNQGVYKAKLVIKENQATYIAAVFKRWGGDEGVWVDPITGYQWQNPPATNTMTWQGAVDYCNGLNRGGETGWELPTISQLRTLINGCPATQTGSQCRATDSCLSLNSCRTSYCNGCGSKSGCYWDSNLQGDCAWYWSSSFVADDDAGLVWVVGFSGADVHFSAKGSAIYVRCVQDGPKEFNNKDGSKGAESIKDNLAIPKTIPPLKEKIPDGTADIEWIYSSRANVYFTKSEVTLSEYKMCLNAGVCENKHHLTKSDNKYCNFGYGDRGNHPMNCVDWYGAKAFCIWAGGNLPTEAEWRAEASNGSSRGYPWGNVPATCNYVVMDEGGNGCGRDSTWPVCNKANGNSISGLCDMSGNVWEWIESVDANTHVILGGAWRSDLQKYLISSSRLKLTPDGRRDYLGFRCVRSYQ